MRKVKAARREHNRRYSIDSASSQEGASLASMWGFQNQALRGSKAERPREAWYEEVDPI